MIDKNNKNIIILTVIIILIIFDIIRHLRRTVISLHSGVVSRKPRNFRQPINMACLALGR